MAQENHAFYSARVKVCPFFCFIFLTVSLRSYTRRQCCGHNKGKQGKKKPSTSNCDSNLRHKRVRRQKKQSDEI